MLFAPEIRYQEQQEEEQNLSNLFKKAFTIEQRLQTKLVRSLNGDYDTHTQNLLEWSDAKNERNRIFNQHLQKCGLSEKPQEGYVRIFRGVQWPWDTNKILPNQYWIEDYDHAMNFARNGDLVVLDIPEEKIYRVEDPDKQGEIQLPDPESAKEAIIIIRNGKLSDPNKPLKPNLMNLLESILNNRNTAPKEYSMLHDQYIATE